MHIRENFTKKQNSSRTSVGPIQYIEIRVCADTIITTVIMQCTRMNYNLLSLKAIKSSLSSVSKTHLILQDCFVDHAVVIVQLLFVHI